MIKNLVLLLFFVSFSSCEEKSKENQTAVTNSTNSTNLPKSLSRYPTVLQNIFKAHGDLNTWNSRNTLQFSFDTSDITETHTTDLKSRKAHIESTAYTIGFDGENAWIKDDNNNFDGNAYFYYNLMFYFYAMPFVISDPGVFYTERKDTTLEFKTYGTLHIGFRRSVGSSPNDEYIIYYNKKTFEMAWLGYTVTYFDKKRSTEWHFIKYDEWQTINGLKLPKTMVWYDTKSEKPQNPQRKVEFFDVSVSSDSTNSSLFEPIEGAVFVD